MKRDTGSNPFLRTLQSNPIMGKRVFVWSAIRLDFCKTFWGVCSFGLRPLRRNAVTPFAIVT